MKTDRFQYLCQEVDKGSELFINHPSTGERGRLQSCSMDHVVVETDKGERRCWDFRECDEIRSL